MLKLFERWQKVDSASNAVNWLWWGAQAIFGFTAASIMGYAAAQLQWFWDTFRWAGAFGVGIVTWIIVGVGLRIWTSWPNAPFPWSHKSFASIAWEQEKPNVDADYVVQSTVTFSKPVRGVVLFGRRAEAIAYIDGSVRWKWSPLSKRLIEQAIVHEGEKLMPSMEVIRRPAEGADRIRILGQDKLLGNDPGSANIFQVELVLVADGEKRFVDRKAYHFLPMNAGKFSQPMRLDDLGYIVNENKN
jgi:hypothetical protein